MVGCVDCSEWHGKINVLQLIYNKKQNKWDKYMPIKCLVSYNKVITSTQNPDYINFICLDN